MNYYAVPGLIANKFREQSMFQVTQGEACKVVVDSVVSYTGISFDDIKKKNRARHRVQTRQMLCYLLCDRTKMTLKDIGILIGGKDHTTVIHGRKTFRDLVDTDPVIRKDLKAVEFLIGEKMYATKGN